MSLKVPILHASLMQILKHPGDIFRKQGERSHQDIMDFELLYQSQYNKNIMGYYIWSLVRGRGG